jgi:hypothetical protein
MFDSCFDLSHLTQSGLMLAYPRTEERFGFGKDRLHTVSFYLKQRQSQQTPRSTFMFASLFRAFLRHIDTIRCDV